MQTRRVPDETVIEPPSITHPGIVDRVITTRNQPPDAVPVSGHHYIAAVGAARTYAGSFFEKPHPDFMMKVLGLERADRADIRRAHRIIVVEAAVVSVEH